MSVDDHGLEVLKKAGYDLDGNGKKNYALQVQIKGSDVDLSGSTETLITYIDKVSGALTYYGFAIPASLTSDPVWRILKEEKISGVKTYLWADGNNNKDNVWDDRASLVYE